MPHCTNCGTLAAEEHRYCSACGNPLQQQAELKTTSSSKKPGTARRRVLRVGGLVFLISVLVVPWHNMYSGIPSGWSPIWAQPYGNDVVNLRLLLVQCFAVIIMTAIFYAATSSDR